MSKIKDALLDLEEAHDLMEYRRAELSQFKAANEYTRGGSYPKAIASRKANLARAMVGLHAMLYLLDLTKMPVRAIKISRKRTVYSAV